MNTELKENLYSIFNDLHCLETKVDRVSIELDVTDETEEAIYDILDYIAGLLRCGKLAVRAAHRINEPKP